MLEEVRIRDLGVIREAVLDLHPGFTALTGETGAGKTMVVHALGLLLGERADLARVRAGADRAAVDGRVLPPPAVAERAGELGGDADPDGTLLLGRTVAGGRSRAWVGGQSVPVASLAGLAEQLVTVHGQSDQLGLLRPSVQREALDRFAGAAVAEPLRAWRGDWDRLGHLTRRLGDLEAQQSSRSVEADRLRAGVQEIDDAAPAVGEDDALRAEIDRLGHSERLHAAARAAHDLLAGADEASGPGAGAGATELVDTARRELAAVSDHDPALAPMLAEASELGYRLADLAGDLAGYAAGVEADPARLQAAQERLALLTALIRRWAVPVAGAATAPGLAELLAWAQAASDRLLMLDRDADEGPALREEVRTVRARLAATGARLSAARAAAAQRFAAAVTEELGALAMPHAQVSVAVTQTVAPSAEAASRPQGPSAGPAARSAQPARGAQAGNPSVLQVDGRHLVGSAHGLDEVAVLLTPHPGAAARPLGRGASGGELSRLMLAVEVVFAGTDPVPTLVFDEVDAGVGGRAAVEIGRRLARLARDHQVVCVTHLPQVAAYADRHLVVHKSDDGQVTTSDVREAVGAQRVVEVSRMLAGLDGSASARAHAQELLDAAEPERAGALALERAARLRVASGAAGPGAPDAPATSPEPEPDIEPVAGLTAAGDRA